ncbi:MAG: YncE family protein [Candidatus Bruticola sp.]
MNKIKISLFLLLVVWAVSLLLLPIPLHAQGLTAPRLLISCFLGDSMSVVDARTVRVKGTFSIGSNPERMSVSPDNRYIAVAQPKNSCISVIESSNMRFGNTYTDENIKAPVDVCFSTDGARLYVLESSTCSLVELHVPSFKVVRTLSLNALAPSLMRISKNGAKMFISHENTGIITVVDLFNWSIFKQVGVGPTAGGLDLSKDNGRLIVALPSESKVGIYKTTDMRLLSKVPVGSGASIVGVSSEDQVVVINSISNDVSIFPLDRPSMRFRTAVGVGPRDLCFAPDGSMCYIANFNTNDLSVIDMKSGHQLGRLAIGQGPRSIVWVY